MHSPLLCRRIHWTALVAFLRPVGHILVFHRNGLMSVCNATPARWCRRHADWLILRTELYKGRTRNKTVEWLDYRRHPDGIQVCIVFGVIRPGSMRKVVTKTWEVCGSNSSGRCNFIPMCSFWLLACAFATWNMWVYSEYFSTHRKNYVYTSNWISWILGSVHEIGVPKFRSQNGRG